ncbi:hypothetical protein [Halalkalibacter akibai]|nr:hypothetical protein [Halalkalibacter akibai]
MATGVLLELRIADSVEKAEQMVREIRPGVELHPEFRKDLKVLYPNG